MPEKGDSTAREWKISLVSRCLRVSRSQLHTRLRRPNTRQDRLRILQLDDTDALLQIHTVIGDLPTYGYRRVWAFLRRQSEAKGLGAVNAKRVYRIIRQKH